MKRIRGVVLASALSLVGLSHAAGTVMVDNAWIREAPPGVMAMAGYMTIHNPGQKGRLLIGAQSSAFSRVMLHRTVLEGGISKMVHQHTITLPAGTKVQFRPNDYHLMMMQPRQRLLAGDTVEVTLQFQDGESQTVSYEVRAGTAESERAGRTQHGSH